jgi:hypothetical protein
MRIRTIVLPVAAALACSGCLFRYGIVSGSEETVTVARAETDFDAVSVAYACEATILKGDSWSAVVEINENIVNYLTIEKSNGTLYVSLSDGHTYNNLKFKVAITMPELKTVSGSGASAIEVSGFNSDSPLAVDLSGASGLNGAISCGAVTLKLSGASRVDLAGSGGNLSCKGSGASKADLRDFVGNDALIDLSGASELFVNATGSIGGNLSGASVVYFYGSPTLGRFNLSGASEVKRG